MSLLLIALGGALGAVSRALITRACVGLGLESGFPSATLIANALGCFLIGLAFAYVRLHTSEESARRISAFFITGYLGSLTTFSTFALQSRDLFSSGKVWLAGLNVLGSVAIGLIFVGLGSALIRSPAAA